MARPPAQILVLGAPVGYNMGTAMKNPTTTSFADRVVDTLRNTETNNIQVIAMITRRSSSTAAKTSQRRAINKALEAFYASEVVVPSIAAGSLVTTEAAMVVLQAKATLVVVQVAKDLAHSVKIDKANQPRTNCGVAITATRFISLATTTSLTCPTCRQVAAKAA